MPLCRKLPPSTAAFGPKLVGTLSAFENPQQRFFFLFRLHHLAPAQKLPVRATTRIFFTQPNKQSEQREMLVESCPYLDDVIPRTPAPAAVDPPSTARGPPETRLVPEVIALDQAKEGGAGSPAAVVAPQQGDGNGGTGSDVAAPNGAAARTGEDQNTAGVGGSSSGGSSGSTVTVLTQKSRRGEPFLEPLEDVKVVATPADSEASPARKKSKVGVGVAVDQHGLAA